jgi:conjugal transfer ATP-binding protein TraC
VILLLLMYLITNEITLNRADGRRKLVIIDEAWSLMNGTSGGFIEAGYRRARKYNGAFVTGTQGVDDYYRNEAATAALNNADWMFMLRQKPESLLALEKNSRLAVSEGMRGMLETLHTEAGPIPKFSCTARWGTASAAWCWTRIPCCWPPPGRRTSTPCARRPARG